MTQIRQVTKTRTDAKTCVSCKFLLPRKAGKPHLLWYCLLTGQPRNPNMRACQLYERRPP